MTVMEKLTTYGKSPGIFFFEKTGIRHVELDDEAKIKSVLRQLAHDRFVMVQPTLQQTIKTAQPPTVFIVELICQKEKSALWL